MNNQTNNPTPPDLSIVIPIYNEEEGVSSLSSRLISAVESISTEYEIIFVNDGSNDSSSDEVLKVKHGNGKVRLISLARNYGHMEALSTGLRVSKGNYIVTMDGDLQHPPEIIPSMYKLIFENDKLDVIQAVRSNRDIDSLFKKITAKFFYKFSARLTGVAVIPHAADFRIMNRKTVETINLLPEKNKILRFLIPELGFNVDTIEFVCDERMTGYSKYSFRRMFAFAFDSIISFSTKPLRMMSIIGFALSAIFMFGSIVTFGIWFFAKTVPGWTSIFLVLLTSNALVLGSLGLLGEYVAKIREATIGRPHARWFEINS